MNLLCRLALLILCSTPSWCTQKREERSMSGHADINYINLHYPEIVKYMPMLCKQYERRMAQPYFRRRQEQVFAVNEQLIPQPFYPFDNQSPQGQQIYIDTHTPIQPPISSTGFDTIPPNNNDLYAINQQQNVQNSYPNDYLYQTQIPRPPITQGYVDPYYPYNPRYGSPPPRNYNKINQPNTNVAKTINIDINAESMKGAQNAHHRQNVRPYNQLQTSQSINTLPTNLNMDDYVPYRDMPYSDTPIYPRSTTYVRFPLELFEEYEPEPNMDRVSNDPKTNYIINPSILSVFDDYIQNKIDASQKSRNQEKRSDKTSDNSDSNKS